MYIVFLDRFVFQARFVIALFSPITHFFPLSWLKLNPGNKIS